MRKPRRRNILAYALFANAAMLAGIMIVLVSRDRIGVASPAFGGATPPIAGAGGIYIMPCELHPSVWGCYLMDTDQQTLCVYEYRSGERALVLTAARHFRYDLGLKDYNTFPAWYDVQKQVEDAATNQRTVLPNPPPTVPDNAGK
jgi:hypothetical protein